MSIKTGILSCILLTSAPCLARAVETIACADQNADWKVDFSLDGKYVSNLKFTLRDQLMASFPVMTAQVSHFGRRYHYELKFDQQSYFSFDRRNNNPTFAGSFLLTQDPIGLETNVICNAH